MTESLLTNWAVWASLGAGIGVSGLVFALGGRALGRRRSTTIPDEEDLPWEEMLVLMKARYGAGGESLVEEELGTDELMGVLRQIPNATVAGAEANIWLEDGADRRTSRRRWANPVEVSLLSPFHEKPVHGLVVNRSTGGLAILTDFQFAPDTVLGVRVTDAPKGIGYVNVCVRHVRRASKLWVAGCQYKDEIPWNVKVWFG